MSATSVRAAFWSVVLAGTWAPASFAQLTPPLRIIVAEDLPADTRTFEILRSSVKGVTPVTTVSRGQQTTIDSNWWSNPLDYGYQNPVEFDALDVSILKCPDRNVLDIGDRGAAAGCVRITTKKIRRNVPTQLNIGWNQQQNQFTLASTTYNWNASNSSRHGWSVGVDLGVSYASFGKFGQTVGLVDDVDSYQSDDAYITPRIGARFQFSKRFFAGARWTRGTLSYRQNFLTSGPATLQYIDADITGNFLDGYIGFIVPIKRSALLFTLGPTYADNTGKFTANYPSGPIQYSRSESGWKFNAGTALEFSLSDRWTVGASYNHIGAFEDIDADQQNQFGAHFVFRHSFTN